MPPWVLNNPQILRIFCVNSKLKNPPPKVVSLPLGLRAYGVQYVHEINAVRALNARGRVLDLGESGFGIMHTRLGMSAILWVSALGVLGGYWWLLLGGYGNACWLFWQWVFWAWSPLIVGGDCNDEVPLLRGKHQCYE